MHIRSLELKIRKLKQIRLTFQTLETFQSGHLHFPARIRNNVTCITSKYWAKTITNQDELYFFYLYFFNYLYLHIYSTVGRVA